MRVVIYRGPEAEGDPSTVYRLPLPDGDVVLNLDTPHPVDKLPKGALKTLEETEGHVFEVTDAEAPDPYPGYRQKTAEQIIGDLRNSEPSTAQRMAEAILASDEQRVTVIEAAEAVAGAAEDVGAAEAREPLEGDGDGGDGEDGEGVSEGGE